MLNRHLIGLAVVVGCLVPLAGAADLVLDYTFAPPTVSQVNIAGVVYDRISLPDAPNGGQPGQPALPVGSARILIPYGEEVAGVEVSGERVLVGKGYRIEPVGKPFPLSAGPTEDNIPRPNEQVYAAATPFPAQRFQRAGTYGFRGYEILYLRLEPTEYIPATGELYYYPHLQVRVRTTPAGRTNSLFRGLTEDAREVAKKVDNPAAVTSYAATRGSRNYDLLIVTTPALESAFVPLQEAHNVAGTITQIHTLAAGTSAEAIRNHIRECYLSDGIRFALIGGDHNDLPAPLLPVTASYYSANMPSDFYFGCFDGGWTPSSPDLVAEVYIGRCPADNVGEVENFVNKTIAYLTEQHGFLEKDLQVGEHLGFGGVSEYATGCMEQLIDGGTFDGYTTVGIPSAVFDIDTLYDSSTYTWPKSELTNRMNAGLHWINHLGHGSSASGLKMNISDVQALTNTDYFFIFTQACDCGSFDTGDCIAEYFTAKTAHGAFAVVMNARYGWGEFASTDGPSQRFHRYFWDGVFNQEVEEKYYYGPANQYAKEMNIPRIGEECMRWCYYETNLLGDPSLVIKGAERELKIKLPGALPTLVDPGVPTTITVQIDPGGEEYVPGTAVLNCSVDRGVFQAVPLVELGDEMYEATLPATPCGSTLEYYFSATGTETGVVNLPSLAPADLFRTYVATYVNIMTDNFETDQGWTVSNDPSLTGGAWERAVPLTPTPQGAPNADFDGSGMCFVTGNVDSENGDVDFGPTELISPPLNLVGRTNPMIQYARWVYCDDALPPATDYLIVQLSADGGVHWVTAERVTGDGRWIQSEIRVRDFVPLTDTVRVKFSIKDRPNNSFTECGVDGLLVYDLYCPASAGEPGDLNCDGVVNVFDIDPFVMALTDPGEYAAAHPDCDYMQADINGDGSVNVFDVDPLVERLTR